MIDILVVGQTPPPYTGQSIMIQKMLEARWEGIRLHHLRMNFSRTTEDIGNFQLGKLFELGRLIFLTYIRRMTTGATVLYYPPAGPHLIPVIRDAIFLLLTRPLFKRTIFHFHAAGLGEFYEGMPTLFRVLFRRAFFHPDVAIRVSSHGPEDGRKFRAVRECVVACGIEDEARLYLGRRRPAQNGPTILYVGVLREDKGILVLLEALAHLRERGLQFNMRFVGGFASSAFERTVKAFLTDRHLEGNVLFSGVLTGQSKAEAYADADVFCFPSYFAAESFGLVLIEAMSFELPVVATLWRAIPDIVDDELTGLLAPIRNPEAIADRLERLLKSPELRIEFGRRGRKKFLARFTVAEYQRHLGAIFRSIARGSAA
jgi:glycosyltransferase involved in cell wall biosynthesis